MNQYATIIVTTANKAAAQELLGDTFFDIPLKKTLSKYWVSSGYFLVEEYNAIVDSGLAFNINTEDSYLDCLSGLGMTRIIKDED